MPQIPKEKELSDPWVPLGEALMDFYSGNSHATIHIRSTIEGDRFVPVGTFFRDSGVFPPLERAAFRKCRGKILDAGAGAGSHAIYLQDKGFDVTGMDISEKAAEVMRFRGLKKVITGDIFEWQGDTFDTILMMMNGIGVCGDIERLKVLLVHLKSLLKPKGQILFDSTDINYVTEYDRMMGTLKIPVPDYYGITHYQLGYGAKTGEIYKWLFIDRKTLKRIAEEHGYILRIIKNKKSQYLARLTLKN